MPSLLIPPQSFWGEHRRRGAGKTARHLVKRISMEMHGIWSCFKHPSCHPNPGILEGLRRQTIRNHILDMENCGCTLQQFFSGCKLCLCSICCDLSSAPWWTAVAFQLASVGWFRAGKHVITCQRSVQDCIGKHGIGIGFFSSRYFAKLGTFSLVSFDHSWYQLRFLLWSNAPWYSRGALLPVVAFAWGCLAVSRCSNIFWLFSSKTVFDSLAILELARVRQELHLLVCY